MHRGGRRTPLVIPADYHVTGTLDPDATGNLYYAGEYNDLPYYVRGDWAYFLWHEVHPVNRWMISITLGSGEPANWSRTSLEIVGDYNPVLPYSGIAHVLEGPK